MCTVLTAAGVLGDSGRNRIKPNFPIMNRSWWTHLQTYAPTALGACTTRFAARYPGDWRRHIQTTEALEHYFHEMYKLQLHVIQVMGSSHPYGFRIEGRSYRIQRMRSYTCSEEAHWAALAMAFALVELEERHVPYVKADVHQPVRRQPKDEKKTMPTRDWRKAG